MANKDFKDVVFWKEGFRGDAQGGFFFRSFDLNKFMEGIEERGGTVVGIEFTGNNCEIICEAKTNDDETTIEEETAEANG